MKNLPYTSTSLIFNISAEISLDKNCLLLNSDVRSTSSAQHFKMAVTDRVQRYLRTGKNENGVHGTNGRPPNRSERKRGKLAFRLPKISLAIIEPSRKFFLSPNEICKFGTNRKNKPCFH